MSNCMKSWALKNPYSNNVGIPENIQNPNYLEAYRMRESMIQSFSNAKNDFGNFNYYASHDVRISESLNNFDPQHPINRFLSDSQLSIEPKYTEIPYDIKKHFEIAANDAYPEYKPSLTLNSGILREVPQGEVIFDPYTKTFLTPGPGSRLIVPQYKVEYSAQVVTGAAKLSEPVKKSIRTRRAKSEEIQTIEVESLYWCTNDNGMIKAITHKVPFRGTRSQINAEKARVKRMLKEFHTLVGDKQQGPSTVVTIDHQMYNRCGGQIYCNTYRRFACVGDEILSSDYFLSTEEYDRQIRNAKRRQAYAVKKDAKIAAAQILAEPTYTDETSRAIFEYCYPGSEQFYNIFASQSSEVINYSDVLKPKIKAYYAKTEIINQKPKIVVDGITKREMTATEHHHFNGYVPVFEETYTEEIPANTFVAPTNDNKVIQYDLDKAVTVSLFNEEGKINVVDPVKDEQFVVAEMLTEKEYQIVKGYVKELKGNEIAFIGADLPDERAHELTESLSSLISPKSDGIISRMYNFSNKKFPTMVESRKKIAGMVTQKRAPSLGFKELAIVNKCRSSEDLYENDCKPVSPFDKPIVKPVKPRNVPEYKPYEFDFVTQKFKNCKGSDVRCREVPRHYNPGYVCHNPIRYEMINVNEPTPEIILEMLTPEYLDYLEQIKQNFASIGCSKVPIVVDADMKFEVINGWSGKRGFDINDIDYNVVAKNLDRIKIKENFPIKPSKCSNNMYIDESMILPIRDKPVKEFEVEYVKDPHINNAIVYKFPMGPYPVEFRVEHKAKCRNDYEHIYRYVEYEGEILEIPFGKLSVPNYGALVELPVITKPEFVAPYVDGNLEMLYKCMSTTVNIPFPSYAMRNPPTAEEIAEYLDYSTSDDSCESQCVGLDAHTWCVGYSYINVSRGSRVSEGGNSNTKIRGNITRESDDGESGQLIEADSIGNSSCDGDCAGSVEELTVKSISSSVMLSSLYENEILLTPEQRSQCASAPSLDVNGHSCTLFQQEEIIRKEPIPTARPYYGHYGDFTYRDYAEFIASVCRRKPKKIEDDRISGTADKHAPFHTFYDMNTMIYNLYGEKLIYALTRGPIYENSFHKRINDIVTAPPLDRSNDVVNIKFLSRKRHNCPDYCWWYEEARKRFYERYQPTWWDRFMAFTDDNLAAAFFMMQYTKCVVIDTDLLPGGYSLVSHIREKIYEEKHKCMRPDTRTYLYYIDDRYPRVNREIAYHLHYWKNWAYDPSKNINYTVEELRYREKMWRLIFRHKTYVDYELHPELHPVLAREIINEKAMTTALYCEVNDMLRDPSTKRGVDGYTRKEIKESLKGYMTALEAVVHMVKENNMYYELFVKDCETIGNVKPPPSRRRDPFDELDFQREDVRDAFMTDRIIVTNCYSIVTVLLAYYFEFLCKVLSVYKKLKPSQLTCVKWKLFTETYHIYDEFTDKHPEIDIEEELSYTQDLMESYEKEVCHYTGKTWDEYVSDTGFDISELKIIHVAKVGREEFLNINNSYLRDIHASAKRLIDRGNYDFEQYFNVIYEVCEDEDEEYETEVDSFEDIYEREKMEESVREIMKPDEDYSDYIKINIEYTDYDVMTSYYVRKDSPEGIEFISGGKKPLRRKLSQPSVTVVEEV